MTAMGEAGGSRRGVVRRNFVGRALRLVDCGALLVAFAVVEAITSRHASSDSQLSFWQETIVLAFAMPTWLLLAKARGLYDRDRTRADHSTPDEIAALVQLITFGSWITLISAYIVGLHPYLPRFIAFWGIALVLLVTGRAALRAAARRARPYAQRTLIVGAGDVGQLVAQKVVGQAGSGIELVGFIDADPKPRPVELGDIPILGRPEEIRSVIEEYDIQRIVVAFHREVEEQTLGLIRNVRDLDHVHIDIVPRLFDSLGPRATIHTIAGFPLVNLPQTSLDPSSLFVKRCFDVVGAAAVLIVLMPLLVVIPLMIKLDSPGPVFYRQERIGRNGRRFRIFKFRTMRVDADEHLARLMANDPELRREWEAQHKLSRDPRVTPIGTLLRKSSLDEVPQILNVLLGDMSLVGPRPIVEAEQHRYRDDLDRLIDLPPGMTGYWQISGRSNASYPERVRLDMAYVRNWSLGLDLLILAKTVRTLFSRQGAY
jgi:exopolysaccharide biosynthesis polyprenyl glycosylphosphotransferase